MKPWEQLFIELYQKATEGNRRYVTLPLVVIFIAVPALSGFVESYEKLAIFISNVFEENTVHIDTEEKDLLVEEEWALVIDSYSDREAALKARTAFMQDYLAANHLNSAGQPIWKNDVLVVRDPKQHGRWVLAIDMYKQDYASEETLLAGKSEMIESERKAGVRGGPLQRWLSSAKPHKFEIKEFEKTWGRIANL